MIINRLHKKIQEIYYGFFFYKCTNNQILDYAHLPPSGTTRCELQSEVTINFPLSLKIMDVNHIFFINDEKYIATDKSVKMSVGSLLLYLELY